MKRLKLLLTAVLLLATFFVAQAQRSITFEDVEKWQRITSRTISDDGKWVAATFAPWRGDSRVELYSADGKEKKSYSPANESRFSSSSQYFIVKEVPALQLTDSLKLKKAKKMPMDKLTILSLADGNSWQIDSLATYRLAESHDIIAYQRLHRDSALVVSTLSGKHTIRLPKVTSYSFAKKSATLYFTTKDTVGGTKPGLYLWNSGDTLPTLVKSGKENFVNITINEDGTKTMFLYTDTPKDRNRTMALWLSQNGDTAREIVTRATAGVPTDWIISTNYHPWFSKDNKRIFLGTAPMPLEKDTTILDSNRPNVQVWSWNEPVQYTVQKHNLNSELKRSYVAVYSLEESKLTQIADTALPNVQLPTKGVGEWALLSTSRPYSLSSMWEGRTRSDYYKVSLADGCRTPIVAADYTNYRLSTGGKYALGYNPTDSCWYTINLQTEKNQLTRLTTPDTFVAWDEDNDVPDYPSPHGYAGWTNDDTAILLYDRYDIWQFHPMGSENPVNLTKNGRTTRVRYRRQRIDNEETFIDAKKLSIFTGFNEIDKTTQYFSSKLSSPAAPKQLTEGAYRYNNITKARKAEKYIYTRENTKTFPDVWVANASLKKAHQLTQGIEQQKPFIWNDVELVSWVSYDGVKLEGLLYKPANFDPSKKYPMIVNFYERSSHEMRDYIIPRPNRSTVDYSTYLSDGYIIFNPDVRYGGGYPGKSCYDCVMSGIDTLLTRGYIDSTRIGAQGHSWGGYQVAYLATRTDRFAAIESGAPVVNMFSAYGGIRWGSGLARSFQYEHTQSRLGGTPWSHPERYHESSPLFAMDKVTTPILIMHNDQDGHVPWYQGIEYFVALKRLGKPAWLLNYTGEPHWPTKYPNSMDFQIRMKQFFDHYLKGAPMPKWMSEGVPAVKQPYELGY
ncbi:MAG: S9 family peptidase [Bacteroidaceae bacterium]|nr:S9 family peptidase [Bacteroidaceae bacterium]